MTPEERKRDYEMYKGRMPHGTGLFIGGALIVSVIVAVAIGLAL